MMTFEQLMKHLHELDTRLRTMIADLPQEKQDDILSVVAEIVDFSIQAEEEART